MPKIFRLAPVMGLLLVPSAASLGDQNCSVHGEVFYHQRIALPPNAVVKVLVEDTAIADAAAIPIGGKNYAMGQRSVPFAFSIDVDCERLKRAVEPTIRARITANHQLRFVSDTTNRVAPGKSHRIKLRMVK